MSGYNSSYTGYNSSYSQDNRLTLRQSNSSAPDYHALLSPSQTFQMGYGHNSTSYPGNNPTPGFQGYENAQCNANASSMGGTNPNFGYGAVNGYVGDVGSGSTGYCRNSQGGNSYTPNFFRTERGRRYSTLDGGVPLSRIRPGSVRPSEAQLGTAFAYGIRREDGKITRLVRADMLTSPAMNIEMPQWQGEEGLIILPPPRLMSPRRRGEDPIVDAQTIHALNRDRCSNAPIPANTGFDNTQMQIDSIINRYPRAYTPPRRRREKIYCDKWIHEGVCAFTQMGCKYKHEMPTDKATQLMLGLNHGVPNWYRRAHQGCGSSTPTLTSPSGLPSPSGQRAIEGNWRRQSDAAREGNRPSSSVATHASNRAQSSGNATKPSFGPIGPPPPQSPYVTNFYDTMKTEDPEEDIGDGTVTYSGRSDRR